MPLTQALLRPSADIEEHDLYEACFEIVPAGMHVDPANGEGQLTPGSIEFDARRGGNDHYLTVDVVIDIEAFPFEGRKNLDERAENIRAALIELFPNVTFAVWPKLVKAGWASDSIDPEFDGDMSMRAAIDRARQQLGGVFALD